MIRFKYKTYFLLTFQKFFHIDNYFLLLLLSFLDSMNKLNSNSVNIFFGFP